jgi:hypothetical protein
MIPTYTAPIRTAHIMYEQFGLFNTA